MAGSRRFSWLVLVLGVCFPLHVAAQPDAGTRAVELGQQALSQYERGQWLEALDAFRAADALYHSPVFLLYIARCLRHANRLLEGREAFREVTTEAMPPGTPRTWLEAQSDAVAELSALEAEIPRIVIRVRGRDPITALWVDQTPARVGQPIELDPGRHRVVARTATAEMRRDVELAPGVRATVDVVFPTTTRSLLGPLVTGAGATLLLAGGVLGVLSVVNAADVRALMDESNCQDGRCPQRHQQAIEREADAAVGLGTASAAMLIGGLVSTSVGIALWLRDDTSASVRLNGRGGSLATLEMHF